MIIKIKNESVEEKSSLKGKLCFPSESNALLFKSVSSFENFTHNFRILCVKSILLVWLFKKVSLQSYNVYKDKQLGCFEGVK